jgi:uncharacterized protein
MGDILKIRINAVPEKGKANKELIKFISKKYNIEKSKINIISGMTSRIKIIEVPDSSIKF